MLITPARGAARRGGAGELTVGGGGREGGPGRALFTSGIPKPKTKITGCCRNHIQLQAKYLLKKILRNFRKLLQYTLETSTIDINQNIIF